MAGPNEIVLCCNQKRKIVFSVKVSQFFAMSKLLVTSLEFFTSAPADGHPLEFEWQQVSSSLQDSSQYSDRSQ